jgi:hypothetical protein
MKSLSFLAAVLAVACAPLAQADQVYTYTGGNFTQVSGTYSTSESIQGRIRLSGPLPAFRPLSDASSLLLDFQFDDGVHQTRSKSDSFVCTFELATDSEGNIIDWSLFLREQPFSVGQSQNSLEIYGHGGVRDQAGTVEAGTYACAPAALQTYGVRTTASVAPWAVDIERIFYDGFDGG